MAGKQGVILELGRLREITLTISYGTGLEIAILIERALPCFGKALVDGCRVLKLIYLLFNIVQRVLKYLKLLVKVKAVHELLTFLFILTLLYL